MKTLEARIYRQTHNVQGQVQAIRWLPAVVCGGKIVKLSTCGILSQSVAEHEAKIMLDKAMRERHA